MAFSVQANCCNLHGSVTKRVMVMRRTTTAAVKALIAVIGWYA